MGFVSQLLKKSWADYSVKAVVSRLGEMSAFTSQTSSAHIKTSVLGCDQSLHMGVPLLELTNVCDKDFDPVFPYRRCCLPWGYKWIVCVWPGPWLIVMEGVPFTGGHKCSVCVWPGLWLSVPLETKSWNSCEERNIQPHSLISVTCSWYPSILTKIASCSQSRDFAPRENHCALLKFTTFHTCSERIKCLRWKPKPFEIRSS